MDPPVISVTMRHQCLLPFPVGWQLICPAGHLSILDQGSACTLKNMQKTRFFLTIHLDLQLANRESTWHVDNNKTYTLAAYMSSGGSIRPADPEICVVLCVSGGSFAPLPPGLLTKGSMRDYPAQTRQQLNTPGCQVDPQLTSHECNDDSSTIHWSMAAYVNYFRFLKIGQFLSKKKCCEN